MSPGILSEFMYIHFVNYLKLFEETFLTKMIQSSNPITGVKDLNTCLILNSTSAID